MKFIMAQPAIPRFQWELEVCLTNLLSKGIDRLDIILLFTEYEPNVIKYLQKKYGIECFSYQDKRTSRFYIPSVKPYLWWQFLKNNKSMEKEDFFYMDADVIFKELPDFSKLNGNKWWGSNCDGYLSAHYIDTTGKGFLESMSKVVGVDSDKVRQLQPAIGAQWKISKPTEEYWRKVYEDSDKLYAHMLRNIPIYTQQGYKPIQSWTAEMWSQLWNTIYFGIEIEYSPELDFCWATDDIISWNNTKIYHNAGVLEGRKDLFFKGKYVRHTPFGEDFSYVDRNKCSFKYVEAIQQVK